MKQNKISSEIIIKDIKEAIASIVNQEFSDKIQLNENSKFTDDIELDSIEMTGVFEIIMNKYEKAPFIEWLSEMEAEQIINLTVSEITTFITKYY